MSILFTQPALQNLNQFSRAFSHPPGPPMPQRSFPCGIRPPRSLEFSHSALRQALLPVTAVSALHLSSTMATFFYSSTPASQSASSRAYSKRGLLRTTWMDLLRGKPRARPPRTTSCLMSALLSSKRDGSENCSIGHATGLYHQ